ncbi:hypothetical protein KJ780_01620, partial [Candidatus Micrarchaeota archaeon]|nr:hypothetical protein [Candidatus Micrarchaeota archaeon]
MKFHLIIFAAVFLIIAGCFTPNMQGPCCTYSDAIQGTCTSYTAGGADTDSVIAACGAGSPKPGYTCDTQYCVFAEPGTVGGNATQVYAKYTSGGRSELDCTDINLSDDTDPCNNIGYCFMTFTNDADPNDIDYASYPICSERNETGFDENCKYMLCGNLKYAPSLAILPDPNRNFTSQNYPAGFSTGLKGAQCDFFTLNAKNMRNLKRSTNLFINTFRFGVGSSISDYEVSKLYFPLSDRLCGFVPSDYDVRDRYMNYLNLSDPQTAFGNGGISFPYYGPFDPSTINTSVCAQGSDFPPAAGLGYLTMSRSEGSVVSNTYTFADIYRYKNSLYAAYWDDIRNGTLTTISHVSVDHANTSMVPFECASAMDCASTRCSKDDFGYERAYCELTNDSLANCLCYEYGQRMQAGNYVYCKPYADEENFKPLSVSIHNEADNSDADGTQAASHITFFNETKLGYIGYAAMDEAEFQNSMFYKRCELTGADYDVSTGNEFIDEYTTTEWNNDANTFARYACINPQTVQKPRFFWYTYVVECSQAKNIIKIKSIGNCKRDNVNSPQVTTFPLLKNTLGLCEPCTHSTTMSINLDGYYNAFNPGGCLAAQCSSQSFPGTGMIIDGACMNTINARIADIAAFRNRFDNYLKGGVMPIVWYLSSPAEGCMYSGGYKILHCCLGGASNCWPGKNLMDEALAGSKFYFQPDGSGFFNRAVGNGAGGTSCACTAATYSKKDDEPNCGVGPNPGSFSPSVSNSALGEFGDSDLSLEDEDYTMELGGCTNIRCSWSAYYSFIEKTIGNSASILVIASDSMGLGTISSRINMAKAQCPKCTIALYSPNLD